MLERRLPKEDVDDVAQTVLCDALAAAERIPSDPIEMRRWLAGIARHKVADFHRRRARVNARTDRLDDDGFEPAVSPAPLEARAVLAGVIGETAPSSRDRQTLSWIVREHEGDRLADIAKEEGLPSPVVRQRVSRLRRALRQRWASALVVLLLAGGAAGAYGYGAGGGGDVADISADPSSVAAAPAAAPAGPFDGTWRVEKIEPKMKLTPEQRAMLDAEIPTARVKVHGTRIEITAHAGTLVLTARDFHEEKDGAFTAVVSTGSVSQRVQLRPQGQRMRVTVKEGRFAGEAVLAR